MKGIRETIDLTERVHLIEGKTASRRGFTSTRKGVDGDVSDYTGRRSDEQGALNDPQDGVPGELSL